MIDLVRCHCTRVNNPWRTFCGGCGAALQPACRCGFVNGKNDRFCGGCGVAIFTASTSYLTADTARTLKLPPKGPLPAATGSVAKKEPKKEPTTMPIELLIDIT